MNPDRSGLPSHASQWGIVNLNRLSSYCRIPHSIPKGLWALLCLVAGYLGSGEAVLLTFVPRFPVQITWLTWAHLAPSTGGAGLPQPGSSAHWAPQTVVLNVIHGTGLIKKFLRFSITFVCVLVYFWLCWVFSAVHRLSLAAASRACFALWRVGFSLQWLLCVASQKLQVPGASMAVMQGLSSHPAWGFFSDQRLWTSVHCIARRALNHWKSHITMWLFTVLVSVPKKETGWN